MKRYLLVIFSVLLLFSIFSIGQVAFAENDKAESDAKSPATDLDIIAMSNYMNDGGLARSGDWSASWVFSDNGMYLRSTNTVSGESTIIGKKVPIFVIPDGNHWIYSEMERNSRGALAIKRVRVSGGCEETLIAAEDVPGTGTFYYLLSYKDKLYFTKNDVSKKPAVGGLFCSDRDGSNITQILDKAVYYPYIVDNKIYYQDDNDGSRLHVCDLDGSNDQVLIDDACFDYYFDGDKIYFSSFNGEQEYDENGLISHADNKMFQVKVYSKETGISVLDNVHGGYLAYDGNILYYSDVDDDYRLYSYNPETEEIRIMYLEGGIVNKIFLSSGKMLVKNYTNDLKNYEGMLIANLDGTGMS